MKHQYYGDVNDYIKYGLLRIFAATTRLRLGVAWMLTPPGPPNEGGRIAYLSRPDLWKSYDPELFCLLRKRVVAGQRNAHWAVHDGLLPPDTLYFPPPVRPTGRLNDRWVPSRPKMREAYFRDLAEALDEADLCFFDPDNGLEVKSVPKGHISSPKYVYYDEIAAILRTGRSVMVLQYFPRQQRGPYLAARGADLKIHLPPADIWALEAANIGLFLIGHPQHQSVLHAGLSAIRRSAWHPRQVRLHSL
jgi:hypothetical protein